MAVIDEGNALRPTGQFRRAHQSACKLAEATHQIEADGSALAHHRYVPERRFGAGVAVRPGSERVGKRASDLVTDRCWIEEPGEAHEPELTEVGNRDRSAEQLFLDAHYRVMPRTMLRYAIEKFPPPLRTHYMGSTGIEPDRRPG